MPSNCIRVIAADTAIFGQTGPRVGSVDPGFGTAYLARVIIGREIWAQGRSTLRYGLLSLVLVSLIFSVATALALNVLVLARPSEALTRPG